MTSPAKAAPQLALPLEWPADPGDDAFLVSDSNSRAAQMLVRWASWPVMSAILTGPRKSGRSLLARIFAAKSGGTIIDDAERQNETAIFHAWNRAQETRTPLVIVADAAPPEWQVTLPDLRSRLAASPVARIADPDEALARALLEQLFLRRGLDARDELLQWLVLRLERNHVSLLRAVEALDEAVLAERRRLSVPFARTTLSRIGLITGRDPESGS